MSYELLVILLMVFSGIASTVSNKYLVTGLRLRCGFYVASIQGVTIVSILLLINLLWYPEYIFNAVSVIELREWCMVSLCLAGMVYTGLKCNEYFPISLFSVAKNASIALIAVYEWVFDQYQIGQLTILCFLLVLVSSLVGAISGDIERQCKRKGDIEKGNAINTWVIGSLWVLFNCTLSASYLVRLRRTIKLGGIPSTVAAMYANTLSLPVLTIFAIIDPARRPSWRKGKWVALSGITTALVAVSTAAAANTFRAATLGVINALNKAPISVSGAVLGLEPFGPPWKWVSVAISLCAALAYTGSKTK